MQKHVNCIHVIIGGLLEVESVLPHLLYSLSQQNFPAEVSPALARRQTKKCSKIKQGQRFAQQVSIRRKISGEISFDMTPAQIKHRQPSPTEIDSEERALLQQEKSPNPCYA